MIRKLIQTWQGALGITLILRLEAVDRAELRTRLEKGDYEIAFCPRDSLRLFGGRVPFPVCFRCER